MVGDEDQELADGASHPPRLGGGHASHAEPAHVVHGGAQLLGFHNSSLGHRGLDAIEQLGDHSLGQPTQHDASLAVTPDGHGRATELLELGTPGLAPGLVVGVTHPGRVGCQAFTGDNRARPKAWTGLGRSEALVARDEVLNALALDRPESIAAQAQSVNRGGATGGRDPAHCAQAVLALLGAASTMPAKPLGAGGTQPGGAVRLVATRADGIAEEAVGRIGRENLRRRIPAQADQTSDVQRGDQPVRLGARNNGRGPKSPSGRAHCGSPDGSKRSGPRRSTAPRRVSAAGCMYASVERIEAWPSNSLTTSRLAPLANSSAAVA